MTNIQDFYAEPHLDRADGFGSLAGGRSNPHRGFDVNRHNTGTPVPSIVEGIVVRSERQTGLGNVVVVRRANGTYIGYAHLDSRNVIAGEAVQQGTIVGTLGNTGTLTTGPHTHVTASKVSDNPSVGGVIDPLPYILWARDGGADPDGATPAPQPGAEWDFGQQYADQARIQAALAARGRYSGPVDGVWGENSIKGIQTTCANVGYDGPIDGIPGPNTCHYVQIYAQRFGDYNGPIDSILGPNSWAGFALGLERP